MANPSEKPPLAIAVLISGGGTTLLNLIEKIDAGELNVEIRLVISSHSQASGLKYAVEAAIPTLVVDYKKHAGAESFSQAVFQPCHSAGVDLVVMGGFIRHVLIPAEFENRVLNIHPALIPAFCGKGFHGSRVHRAVLEYGAKVSGCTVHFVDNDYDHGPIILQRVVEVQNNDTPETLAARIFQAECQAYPEALRLYAAGKVRIDGRKITVDR